jgi:orotate phosphoribosyltransferase
METIFPVPNEDPLTQLARCGGYYDCPKDDNGKRLGPLVGYAGRDEEGKQFVGYVYADFSKAERHMPVLWKYADSLRTKLVANEWDMDFSKFATGFCGAPEGGKALAATLAGLCGKQYIFPEKKVTAVETPNSREESTLVFGRHEPEPGEVWWITEDVCNNFSTTAAGVELIESRGASVGGIICLLNRSLDVDTMYSPREGHVLPVVSLVRMPIAQYRQDDPFVAEDIAKGNVVWKPKNEWHRLAV